MASNDLTVTVRVRIPWVQILKIRFASLLLGRR